VLHPEEMVEHPYLKALAPSLQARIDAWEGPKDDEGPQHIYDLSAAPGWKIGRIHRLKPHRVAASGLLLSENRASIRAVRRPNRVVVSVRL
jgi:hypothetical protein